MSADSESNEWAAESIWSIAGSQARSQHPSPEKKSRAIEHVAAVLEPDGVLFGGTVLGLDEDHTAPARAFLKSVNKQGAFDNLIDTRDTLDAILTASFSEVEIDTVGSLALFTARNPSTI